MDKKRQNIENYTVFLLDQFFSDKNIASKKMFGGVGFFREGIMFGMIDGGGTLLFKVDETNIKAYKDMGSQPFKSPSKKGSMPYWTVPSEVIEDRDRLNQWAEEAFEIALSNKK